MKLNKIGEVWNSANRLLGDFIGLLSSKNFATTVIWRNDSTLYLLSNISEMLYKWKIH